MGNRRKTNARKKTLVGPYVSRFLKEWLPILHDRSEHTVRSYATTLEQLGKYMHLKRGIGPSKLSFEDLGPEVLTAFLAWLEDERGMKPSSRNTRLGAIKAFANYVQFEDPSLLDFCVAAGALKPKRTEEPAIKYISKEAMAAVIGEAAKASARDHAMMQLLYTSGARESEFVGINIGSVRLGKGRQRTTVELHGKGRKARIVPIDKRTETVLRAYMKNLQGRPGDPLFRNRRGERLSCSGLKHIVGKYGRLVREQRPDLLGTNLSPHMFRHSIATHMLRAGVSLEFLRLFLGHSSIETTMVYAKVDPDAVLEAVSKIESDLLEGAKPLERQEKESLLSWLDESYLRKHRS